VLVIAPYAVTVPLAFVLAERLDAASAAGLTAVVLAPGALLAPALVNAAGGRRSDMAGALVLGTVIVSFVLVVARPSASTSAIAAVQAFVVASVAAGAVPTVRDRLLVPLRWAGYIAALAVVVSSLVSAPKVDAGTVIVATAVVAFTLVVAGASALALRRDLFSALAAAGTRDPVAALALAWSMGGADATTVPLVTAAILGIAAAALLIRRR
jgi:hypothetical protein